MRKPEQNIELHPSIEAVKELSKENLEAIESWLGYLKALAEAKESQAEPMQKDLLERYEATWKIFLTNPEKPNERDAVVSREQIVQIKQAFDDWHKKVVEVKAEAQQKKFGEMLHIANIKKFLEKTGLFSAEETVLISGFYLHDTAHINTDGEHFPSILFRQINLEPSTYTISKQTRDQFEQQLENLASSVRFSAYPDRWLYELIAQRTRERIGAREKTDNPQLAGQLEARRKTFDAPNDIALPIALALQRRFIKENYEITVNPPVGSEPKGSVIIVRINLKSQEIPVDSAILSSLVYNLAKNAGKAIQTLRKRNPQEARLSQIEIEINEGIKSWSFVVTDSGSGMETDAILQKAGWMVKKATPEELTMYKNIVGEKTIKILQDWIQKRTSTRVRLLTLGKVWDLAKLPKLSGFNDQGVRDSSGFGLYGADYVAKNYNGTIAGANCFGKGAIFVVEIPKNKNFEQKLKAA